MRFTTGKRLSPEERRKLRASKAFLSKVDKKFRTRKGAEIEKKLMEMQEGAPNYLVNLEQELKRAKPPRRLRGTGRRIYSGLWRSFDSTFARNWWAKQVRPICHICGKRIYMDATGADAPSIDHVHPWSVIKDMVDTHEVCCNGLHWTVAYSDEVREALQDSSNLLPAHKGCNSSKNGPKGRDSLGPQRCGYCPGPKICNVSDAE